MSKCAVCKGTGWVLARGSEPDAEPDAQWPCSACCGTGREQPDLDIPVYELEDDLVDFTGSQIMRKFTLPTGESVTIICDVYGIYFYSYSMWQADRPTAGESEGFTTLYDAMESVWEEWRKIYLGAVKLFKNHPCRRCSGTGWVNSYEGVHDVEYCPQCFSNNHCPDCYGTDLYCEGKNAICLSCGWEIKEP